MHGMSGIYMGNAIMIKTVDDGGILPNRYKANVALQATSVDHSVTPGGWTTSVDTLMRSLPEIERTTKVTSTRDPIVRTPGKPSEGGSNGPSSDRSENSLHPVVREAWLKTKAELEAQGWRPQVVTAFRSLEDQAEKLAKGNSKVAFGNHGAMDREGGRAAQAVDVIDSRYSYGNNKAYIANHGKKACKDKAFAFWGAMASIAKANGFTWGGDFKWKGNQYKKDGTYDANASSVNKLNTKSSTHIGWDPGHIEMFGTNGTPTMSDNRKAASAYLGRSITSKGDNVV